jgi:DNA-binding MarR family transcriptional regulator
MVAGYLSKRDKTRLVSLRAVLAAAQTTLSLSQLPVLIAVALEPGLSVNDLAERVGAPQQTASRYASVLLGRYEDVSRAESVAALLKQDVSVKDPRSRALYLTDHGWQVIGKLLTALNTNA